MSSATHRPRHQRGFTVIELMTTLVIAAILVTVAVPSFRKYNANRRMAEISYDLVTDLVLARSEAVKRGANVQLRPNGDGWAKGWVVEVVADGTELRRKNELGDGITVDPAPDEILFNRNGRVTAAGIVRVGVEIDVADISPRCISIDPSGRPRSVKASCT